MGGFGPDVHTRSMCPMHALHAFVQLDVRLCVLHAHIYIQKTCVHTHRCVVASIDDFYKTDAELRALEMEAILFIPPTRPLFPICHNPISPICQS